ncbi:hypothetical protein BJG93_36495 (plasmid) [Paraburkholderia sprentiae WSM5005]|uniref:Uncharacterized protein n=1 Tax=Paraburkholderia sprentiae WSM5005 TaxID=754502 RepID=A0A8F4KHP8_9BURK|nr:hypothetical protein [Paraburkholderia sprentiae]QXE07329.1 hypothetical protein BJG93_36495 [Paraburkholderia sprentiae WSM5005]
MQRLQPELSGSKMNTKKSHSERADSNPERQPKINVHVKHLERPAQTEHSNGKKDIPRID